MEHHASYPEIPLIQNLIAPHLLHDHCENDELQKINNRHR
ncbi:hypothetical protein VCHE16_1998 [Vibrio paracholerae HE-16]|nr:hypothetical protein VCHE16_1998 [Vibrio paracholerae HE-16]